RTQSLVAKKKDISENRASRNFDLMITIKTFEHNSSSLGRQCQETSVANDTSGLVPQRQKASDYDNPDPAPELQNVYPSAVTAVPSQQELDFLFGPLYDDIFNDGTSRVNKSSNMMFFKKLNTIFQEFLTDNS
ncbi:hypothetical protein Tco_0457186, partial [Tanacetum coccineum]